MAKQVVVTDDVTGEPGADTHVIIVDGRGIRIDLTEESVEKLTEALAPFWQVGTVGDYEVTERFGKRKSAPSANGSRSPGRPPGSGTTMTAEEMLAYVREHPGATTAELAEAFGVAAGTVNYRYNGNRDLFRVERTNAPGAPAAFYPADPASAKRAKG